MLFCIEQKGSGFSEQIIRYNLTKPRIIGMNLRRLSVSLMKLSFSRQIDHPAITKKRLHLR